MVRIENIAQMARTYYAPAGIFVLIFIFACTKYTVRKEEIFVYNGLYYSENQIRKTYTGKVVTLYPNGNISSSISLKNGIPKGRYAHFGFDGEEISTEIYVPISTNKDQFSIEIQRVNFITSVEGGIKIYTLDIVCTKKIEITEKIVNEISYFLKEVVDNSILKNKPVDLKFCLGELELPFCIHSIIL